METHLLSWKANRRTMWLLYAASFFVLVTFAASRLDSEALLAEPSTNDILTARKRFFLLIPGLGEKTGRRSLVVANIRILRGQLTEMGVSFSCHINVYGSIPFSAENVEPCTVNMTELQVHEVQASLDVAGADFVAVLFDDVSMETNQKMSLQKMISTMEHHFIDIGTPACNGSSWGVMSPGQGAIFSKFYEPFFTLYTAAAWRCRVELLRITQLLGSGGYSMTWDKYEHNFCHSKIGIFKDMVVVHTQSGGKDIALTNLDTGRDSAHWRKLFEHMKDEHGILPINPEEFAEITNDSERFLKAAHSGYGKFSVEE